jgi:hypothetical protein
MSAVLHKKTDGKLGRMIGQGGVGWSGAAERQTSAGWRDCVLQTQLSARVRHAGTVSVNARNDIC